MTGKGWLFLLLAGFTVYFCYALWRGLRGVPARPTPRLLGIGVVTDFLDTLGIGSFATTTAFYKLWKLVDDRLIPGTLNVGHTLPTVVQAYIYIAIVEVDFKTLAAMIAASVLGAWLGAGVVANWPRRNVQLGMGAALAVAAVLMILQAGQGSLGWTVLPPGGEALGLTGTLFWVGLGANFVLGALMSLGIGLYAPCLILISLLGMNPKAAFPIMMGSCAFLMPVASIKFIRKQAWDPKASLGLLIGGIPAVIAAAYLVKSLPLDWVRWLVVIVVIYTATAMLRSALREPESSP